MLGPLSRQMGPGYLLGTFRNDEDTHSFETITTSVSENKYRSASKSDWSSWSAQWSKLLELGKRNLYLKILVGYYYLEGRADKIRLFYQNKTVLPKTDVLPKAEQSCKVYPIGLWYPICKKLFKVNSYGGDNLVIKMTQTVISSKTKTNILKKRCPALFVTGKVQMKTVRYHHTSTIHPLEWP